MTEEYGLVFSWYQYSRELNCFIFYEHNHSKNKITLTLRIKDKEEN